jgi:hypothetical protein
MLEQLSKKAAFCCFFIINKPELPSFIGYFGPLVYENNAKH